jgi:hypothetical protein
MKAIVNEREVFVWGIALAAIAALLLTGCVGVFNSLVFYFGLLLCIMPP